MILADWIVLGLIVVFMAIGAIVGFGKGLQFFTSGIFGFIIGIVVCVMLGTVFLDVAFVRDLLDMLSSYWAHIDFLNAIHLDIIIYYVALFIIVQIIRALAVWLLKSVFESNVGVVKFFNKLLGAILFLILGVLIMLLVVKVIGLVGGETYDGLYDNLRGSALKLDALLEYFNANK
ncbi:MAG: hypothetical protein K2K80_02685 [Clostridia bacterium]|nr:hypothetical protein [Clostridia bacterium]